MKWNTEFFPEFCMGIPFIFIKVSPRIFTWNIESLLDTIVVSVIDDSFNSEEKQQQIIVSLKFLEEDPN